MGWEEIELLLTMNQEARERLIELIERVRGDRSQRQLAEYLGVKQGAIQGWFNGSQPKPENLKKIADAAGMSVDEVLEFLSGRGRSAGVKTAEELFNEALQLGEEEQRRLIKLLVNRVL